MKLGEVVTLNAAVASTRRLELFLISFILMLLLLGICTRHVWNVALDCWLALGNHSFGGAVDNLAVLDKTFDKPVALAWAMVARVDTLLAQVIVTVVANGAMVMLVGHGLITVVAKYGPGRAYCWRRWCFRCLHAKSKLALVGDVCKLIEE